MGSLLLLPHRVRAELETLAAIGYPDEACGLLLGEDSDGCCKIRLQQATRNAYQERSRDCFSIDPSDYLAVERVAEGLNLQLVGVWHSHPDHPARPSQTDFDMAWPGWSYIIVSVMEGSSVDLRSWRVVDGKFSEEEVLDA